MTYLVIGLGNPGTRYAATRHNAGFMAVDALAHDLDVTMKKKFLLPADMGEARVGDRKVVLAKPTTFMNLSGKAVGALARKYTVMPEHIIVLSDDVTLPLGTIRVRVGGSAGGHNGLKSIIETLGPEFVRVRIGVGAPPSQIPLEAYVLQKFGDDMDHALLATKQAAAAVLDIMQHGAREQTFTA